MPIVKQDQICLSTIKLLLCILIQTRFDLVQEEIEYLREDEVDFDEEEEDLEDFGNDGEEDSESESGQSEEENNRKSVVRKSRPQKGKYEPKTLTFKNVLVNQIILNGRLDTDKCFVYICPKIDKNTEIGKVLWLQLSL